MLRAYSMDSSSAWKLLRDRLDAPAVLYSESFLKNTPHPVVVLECSLLHEPSVHMGMESSDSRLKCEG